MAAAYGLRCQGAGTDYQTIKKALKAGKPVVCLMGPVYFTRGGHFMVLVAIDNNACVTVADVGSRTRSATSIGWQMLLHSQREQVPVALSG